MTSLNDFAFVKRDRLAAGPLKRMLAETDHRATVERLAEAVSGLVPAAA